MSQSPKHAHESADDSCKMRGAASDTHTAPSDQRVFAAVWKKSIEDALHAILLTAKRVYFSDHNKIIVYDIATGQKIKEIAAGGGYSSQISQSRDGKSLFVACHDTVRIIDLATEKEVVLRGHTRAIRCIIQGKSTDVLTCSEDGTARRWNSLTRECLRVYGGAYGWHDAWVYAILYDEATDRIFSSLRRDKAIVVWNSDTGEKVGEMKGHDGGAESLAWVNGTTIASCSGFYDGTIKLWNTATLTCIKTISALDVRYVVATPDGQHLITGRDGDKVKVWSVATGQCLHTLSHHTKCVRIVAVSPDGRFIASSGYDRMLYLFKVSPPFSFAIREEVLVHDAKVKSISLFSDGAIRAYGDAITTVGPASVCRIEPETRLVVSAEECIEFFAQSALSAQLWSEAISAVAADLTLHPEDRAHSADQMISRYRFTLLQTILVHLREPDTLNWHIPREIVQVVGSYCF
jgi:WD40 repeat protein